MDEEILRKAQEYVQLGAPLGSGTHGSVFAAERNVNPNNSAVKVHKEEDPYQRELRVYERLREAGITSIEGFNVPQLLGNDDELLVLEMTVVRRPFLLDFGGAYLDRPPEFPEEVWADWAERKKELFGADWPTVEDVLCTLRGYGIYLLDVHQRNIAFRGR